jgi:hypothetical protein
MHGALEGSIIKISSESNQEVLDARMAPGLVTLPLGLPVVIGAEVAISS